MTQISDQRTVVEESEKGMKYIVQLCPHCWGRENSTRPVCSFGVGLLEEALDYFSGGLKLRVEETQCTAMGGGACVYTIEKV